MKCHKCPNPWYEVHRQIHNCFFLNNFEYAKQIEIFCMLIKNDHDFAERLVLLNNLK